MTWQELADLLEEWALQTLYREDGTAVRQAYFPDLYTPELELEAERWIQAQLALARFQIPPDHLRYLVLPRLRFAWQTAAMKAHVEARGGFAPMKVPATRALHTLLIEDWHNMNRTAWMRDDMPDDFSSLN